MSDLYAEPGYCDALQWYAKRSHQQIYPVGGGVYACNVLNIIRTSETTASIYYLRWVRLADVSAEPHVVVSRLLKEMENIGSKRFRLTYDRWWGQFDKSLRYASHLPLETLHGVMLFGTHIKRSFYRPVDFAYDLCYARRRLSDRCGWYLSYEKGAGACYHVAYNVSVDPVTIETVNIITRKE